jgi:hypothetical protein
LGRIVELVVWVFDDAPEREIPSVNSLFAQGIFLLRLKYSLLPYVREFGCKCLKSLAGWEGNFPSNSAHSEIPCCLKIEQDLGAPPPAPAPITPRADVTSWLKAASWLTVLSGGHPVDEVEPIS